MPVPQNMKNESQRINGTPSVLGNSISTSSHSSSRFNFDEKNLAEIHKHEFNIFPSPPGQYLLYEKRQMNEPTTAGYTSCGSPSSNLSYNHYIHDSHLSMNFHHSLHPEHVSSIHETNFTKSYTLASPTTIYPTPPPSAVFNHWFNDSF